VFVWAGRGGGGGWEGMRVFARPPPPPNGITNNYQFKGVHFGALHFCST